MADRATIHLNKLDDFARWAATKGYVKQDPVGRYEVMRLKKLDKPVLIYHIRLGAKEHASASAQSAQLVWQWLRERRENPL